LQKTVAELVGEKVIDERLAGFLVECLGKLEKEVKEEIANLADNMRKDLMTGMARAIKNGVDTSLMAKVLNAPLIKTYGRITFLQKLTYYAADAENLTKVFRGILDPKHDKSFLFEFHAGTWEAEKRQAKVTQFRKKLESPGSASAEIDAILSDGTHIQASAGNLMKPNPQYWKERYGQRIKVSKENGATRIKFLFRKGAQVHGDILTYLQQTAPNRHKISIEVEFIDFPVPYP